MIDLNATQAAIRAGYSEKGATVRGSELLAIRKVKDRISALIAARSMRTQVTADRVLEELARVAFIPITQLAAWSSDDLTPVPSSDLSDDQAASVKKVKFKRTVIRQKDGGEMEFTEVGVEQHDKLSALDKLARHLNLYGEHGQGQGKSGLETMIEALAEMRKKRG